MKISTRTEYLGAFKVPDGYFKDRITVHLCYDPISMYTLAVFKHGYHRQWEVAPCIDAKEALYYIETHPGCRRLKKL